MLIAEGESAARDRGAVPYGVIAGYGASFDPRPEPGRPPRANLARAIRLALDDARVRPDQVDVVFADAVGVPERDLAEAAGAARYVAEEDCESQIGDLLRGHGRPASPRKAPR